MPSPLEKTINKVADSIERLFNGGNVTPPIVTELSLRNGGKQSCLEKYGIRLRAEHIEQNTWRKNDIEYSKPLIDAEYMIQTEFKVGSTDTTVEEQYSNTVKREEESKAKAAKKAEKKKKKKEEKLNKKASKVAGVPSDSQPGGTKNDTEPSEKIFDYQDNKSNDDATFSDYGYEMA
jgi:hypothetical protein